MNVIEVKSSLEEFYSKEMYAVRPTEPGWSQTFNPEAQLVLRVKVIRLASGERLRFFFTAPKPLTKREQSDMLKRLAVVQDQIAAMRKSETRDIVQRERRLLLRQPTPPTPRGKSKKRARP